MTFNSLLLRTAPASLKYRISLTPRGKGHAMKEANPGAFTKLTSMISRDRTFDDHG
jgi:hypothetical protein